MNRNKYQSILELAIKNTHERFPVFQGVVIFGSFVTDKPAPGDLDIIPVLLRYGSNWDFSPVSEGDPCDDHPDYHEWLKMEKYFFTYFPRIPALVSKVRGGTWLSEGQIRGLHYENLIALDNPRLVKRWLKYYNADPKNFVGTEDAGQKLLNLVQDTKL